MPAMKFLLLGYGLGAAAGLCAGFQYGQLAGWLTAWFGGSMMGLLFAWIWYLRLHVVEVAVMRPAGNIDVAPALSASRAEFFRAGHRGLLKHPAVAKQAGSLC